MFFIVNLLISYKEVKCKEREETKKLSETNHLFIFLVSLSYVFGPMEILA